MRQGETGQPHHRALPSNGIRPVKASAHVEANGTPSLDMLFALRLAEGVPTHRYAPHPNGRVGRQHDILDKLDHGPVGHIMTLRKSLRLIARPAIRPSATGAPSATAGIPTIDVRRGVKIP